jgi:hypothetical protein
LEEYITRLASNEIFLPSNKIHREVGRAKDLSALLQCEDNRGVINDKDKEEEIIGVRTSGMRK